MWKFAVVIAFGLIAMPMGWQFLHEYQKRRILTFLNPEADPLGAAYHIIQSKISLGSGGLLGKGFMQGTQNQFRFLPDQHSDFPFAVWAEEQGLLGSMLLLGLYVFLVIWGLRIASQAKDRFGAVTAVGVSAMLFWQAIINVGMVCGLLPVVGMTLPLFSYGGSSVLTTMLGLGLLMNVSMRRFSHS